MGEITQLKKNSIFYFVSSLSRLVANSLVFIIIARIFGAEDFGSFSTAHTLATLFLLLADFGFDVLITTEIARNRSDIESIVGKYFPIKFVFTFGAAILLAFTNLILPISDKSKTLVLIFTFYMVFTSLLNLLFAFFRGMEKFKYEAIISMVSNFILLLMITILAYIQLELSLIAISMVLVKLISLIAAYWIYKRNLKSVNYNFNFFKLKTEFRKVMIFGFHLLFGTLYFQIDSILILTIRGEFEAGLYQAVFKLMVIALIIPDVMVGALIPTLTRLFSNFDIKWENISRVLFKVLYLSGLLVGFIFFSFSEFILTTIYNKPEYLQSAFLLRVAGIIVFIRYFFETFAASLTVQDKQIHRTITVIIVSIISVSLNIILLPKYGIEASILISLFTNLIAGIFYSIFVHKFFIKWVLDPKFIFPIFIIIILSLPFFGNIFVSNYIHIFAVSLVFIIATTFFNFSAKERQLLFKMKENIVT